MRNHLLQEHREALNGNDFFFFFFILEYRSIIISHALSPSFIIFIPSVSFIDCVRDVNTLLLYTKWRYCSTAVHDKNLVKQPKHPQIYIYIDHSVNLDSKNVI